MIERELYLSLFHGNKVTKGELGRFEVTAEQLVKTGAAIEQFTLWTGSEVEIVRKNSSEAQSDRGVKR